MTTPDPATMFGPPFDEGLTATERHLQSGELDQAQAIFEQLLATAEQLDDDPNIRYLRAYLLTNIGMVQAALLDNAPALVSNEQALKLLRGLEGLPLDHFGRQLCLDILLKALIGQADLLHRIGDMPHAQACLDEAATLISELEGDGTRDLELLNTRALVLSSQGQWGAAERTALAALEAAPADHPLILNTLISLGLIGAATGRFDLAEDYLARAADTQRKVGDPTQNPQLVSHRGYVALRRGDYDRAKEFYTAAAEIFERNGALVDLAVCEQALAFLADIQGQPDTVDTLTAASLARFQEAGVSVAAADTMLLASQRAYVRGEFELMQSFSDQARAVYEAQGLYESCARLDFASAVTIEDNLNRVDHGDDERYTIDSALALALPAALALESARFDLDSGHARAQWLELAKAAMRLVFRLAVRRQDPGLMFELVEFRCAGAPLAPSGSTDSFRLALPPQVAMSPGHDRTALSEYVAAAQARYQKDIVSAQRVESWPDLEGDQPILQVRMADAEKLFFTWRWLHRVTGFGSGEAPGADVEEAVSTLAAALPEPAPDESPVDAMRRAFTTGALADPDTELELAKALAEAFWPPQLTEQLHQVNAVRGRPLIRIQPSPRTAQVPWELLAVDDTHRLIDLADIVTAAPVSLRAQSSTLRAQSSTLRAQSSTLRAQSSTLSTEDSDTVVMVVDPRIPGFPADSQLGSVLGRVTPDSPLTALAERHAGHLEPEVENPTELFRRTDLDRTWLSETLRKGARRLMYVGHVSSAPVSTGQSEDARLHLCCDETTTGFAEPTRRHRPLSAKDLLLGSAPSAPDGVAGAHLWPAPPRVALIACDSGGDLRFTESFGLAAAMLHNGATLVTASRWTLPTTLAFHRLGSAPPTAHPLEDLIIAVDTAHDHPTPVQHLTAWQRENLDRWRKTGRIQHSPLLWAAITSITT